MERHFYMSDDLHDLERLAVELENEGMVRPQIHVLTDSEAQLKGHRLHEVSSLMRTDVIRKGLKGALVGALGFGLVMLAAGFTGMAASFGWTPFVFLAIVSKALGASRFRPEGEVDLDTLRGRIHKVLKDSGG